VGNEVRDSIPEVLRSHAVAVDAIRWLDDLPDLVSQLEESWGIVVGRPLDGATEAYVAEATTTDGQQVVLKLLLPFGEGRERHEITALRLAAGEGCVALLRDDPDRGALLLERLGPSLFELGLPIARRLEILSDAAARVWRPASGHGLPTGADRARHLIDFVTLKWEALRRPCSERAIESRPCLCSPAGGGS
jgi:streptomycin 6-kinase